MSTIYVFRGKVIIPTLLDAHVRSRFAGFEHTDGSGCPPPPPRQQGGSLRCFFFLSPSFAASKLRRVLKTGLVLLLWGAHDFSRAHVLVIFQQLVF